MLTKPQVELQIITPVTPKSSNETTNRQISPQDKSSFATTLDKSTRDHQPTSSDNREPDIDHVTTPQPSRPDNAPTTTDRPSTEHRDLQTDKDPASDLESDPSALLLSRQQVMAEPINKVPLLPENFGASSDADLDFTQPIAAESTLINETHLSVNEEKTQTTTILNGLIDSSPLPADSVTNLLNNDAIITNNLTQHLPPVSSNVVNGQEETPGYPAALPQTTPASMTEANSTEVNVATTWSSFMENKHLTKKLLDQKEINQAADPNDTPIPTVLPTTMASQSTTAAQSADFHAIATSLAATDGEKTSEKSVDLAALQPRQSAETPVVSVPTNTTPITPPKINSDAVNAQPLLAQNGNAMEKAVTQQVQRALIQHLPTGERMMVLRMTPPELGTVRIEVMERNGVLSARIHAEDDSVRVALERFLPGMRAELRASDAPIREITLSDQAQFQRSFADGQQQQQQQGQDHQTNRRLSHVGEAFSLDSSRPEIPQLPRTRLLGGQISSVSVNALA
jgi:flagellar hook-length control protein FliK